MALRNGAGPVFRRSVVFLAYPDTLRALLQGFVFRSPEQFLAAPTGSGVMQYFTLTPPPRRSVAAVVQNYSSSNSDGPRQSAEPLPASSLE